ncbi:ATP-grasp domain-containing protein [Vibrio campbellii]|uniref:ATP-grasp domain-containing protein n=1 Tax=Vibrio campbellii TaxID=680 RepID=UPI001F441F56|nr:ATP-grasp domain-containing protein [Vibrio campbellii]MCE7729345.1 ATP-grasp domain-containing protein [Vibrio campbellii]
MTKIVIAGASDIDDLESFVQSTSAMNAEFVLIENEFMFSLIPPEFQVYVTKTQEYDYTNEIFLPLNEYWISKAIAYNVSNIKSTALSASRSKFFLTQVLREEGLACVQRYFLDDAPEDGLTQYIARLDAGYSSYGIASYKQLGCFNKDKIFNAVHVPASSSMHNVLNVEANKIVVENYLEGKEYSADVFVDKRNVKILRLSYKKVEWIQGKPICDTYITVPVTNELRSAITQWCSALFGHTSVSFGQFDFIVTDQGSIPIDFACRIGGGLSALKQFTRHKSYIYHALYAQGGYFAPYACQKNIITQQVGVVERIEYSIPKDHLLVEQIKVGERLHDNLASSNAKVAAVCYQSEDFNTALEYSKELGKGVAVYVRE